MVDWGIYKRAWANYKLSYIYLTYLCNIVSMQEFLKLGMPQNFFINSKYIELGVYKVHLRLMTLGSLGIGNHSHWKFCNSVNLQCTLDIISGEALSNKNMIKEISPDLEFFLDAPSQFKTFDHYL